jgi:cell division protein FtsZ
MKEYHDVMNTIKTFTAEDAMVIVGTVIEEAMEDRLRVTMVATGLGGTRQKQQVLSVVAQARTGTDDAAGDAPNYEDLARTPTVFRSGRTAAIGQVSAAATNLDTLEIPAFLRKQAD